MNVTLQPFGIDDVEGYANLARNIEADKYMSRIYPLHFMNHKIIESGDCLWMKINIAEEGREKFIGSVWLEKMIDNREGYVLGIVIGGEDNWGQGIGRRAIQLIIGIGMDSFPEMKFISLNVRIANERAIRCYLKSGFKINNKKMKINQKGTRIEYYEMTKPVTGSIENTNSTAGT